jgi:hypothetical protein
MLAAAARMRGLAPRRAYSVAGGLLKSAFKPRMSRRAPPAAAMGTITGAPNPDWHYAPIDGAHIGPRPTLFRTARGNRRRPTQGTTRPRTSRTR